MSIPAHRLDLRGFLDRVRAERRADLVEIEREVDPRYETTAFIVKLEQRMKSPVLLFKNVKGTAFRWSRTCAARWAGSRSPWIAR